MTRDTLTYRYARTTLDAFGCDARSAVAIERHKRPLQQRVADWMTACAVAGLIVVGMLYGLGAL